MSNEVTRREFLQRGSAATAAGLIGAAPVMAQGAEKSSRPNLIFIFNEGQRADALSMAGHPILQTPNQDRIGREGVSFRNAFVTNALCAPARATAITGMWSRSSGALDNQLLDTPLPQDVPVFTDLLRDAGYATAIVGKVHVRNALKERHWDYYFGFNAPVTNYYRPRFAEGRNGVIGPEKTYRCYCDDLVTDRALAWLQQDHGDKPFCLLLWYQTPHAPFFRARRHLDLYNGLSIPKPSTFDDDLKGYPGKPRAFAEADNKIGETELDCVRSVEELCKDYYAGLVAIDENIGRVLGFLEKRGILDSTAIVHSSDHGYFLGEWGMFDKRLMHEPSIRVPMMIRYPRRVPSATVRDEMVLDVDLAPTMLDLCDVPVPSVMQGKSLLPLVKHSDPAWRREWLYDYYEYPGAENVRPHRGIRTETHKLIQWYTQSPVEWELYDLKADPGERQNLCNRPEHAETQEDLKRRLAKLLTQIPARSTASVKVSSSSDAPSA